ncbi:MAG: M48 family metallopeptidase [Acholeplasmataceae bacterium]|nr:M48 family metallopeptidase [Acholeplasmataceae bacterium]
MKQVEKNGCIIPYHIERKKIKNIYFRAKDDYIYVTANKYVSQKDIAILIEHKFDILYKRLQRKVSFKPDEIRLWSKFYKLDIVFGRFAYEIKDDHIICKTKEIDIQKVRKKIYLKEMIKMTDILKDRIALTLKQVDIEALPYKYKYLKSKYGSYHRKNLEITLNTFLATLDPIYLEYVIYHEYAHHKVFNHSKAFYQVLDEMMINHKVIQKRLKKMEII